MAARVMNVAAVVSILLNYTFPRLPPGYSLGLGFGEPTRAGLAPFTSRQFWLRERAPADGIQRAYW